MKLLTLMGWMAAILALSYFGLCLSVPEQVNWEHKILQEESMVSPGLVLEASMRAHPLYQNRQQAVWKVSTGAFTDTVETRVFTECEGQGSVRMWWRHSENGTELVQSVGWRFPFFQRGWKRLLGWENTLIGPVVMAGAAPEE